MKSKIPLMISLLLAAGIASAQAPNTNQPPAPVQSTDQGTTEPAKESAAGKHKDKRSKASAHKDAASASGDMADPAKTKGKKGAAGSDPAMNDSGAKH